MSSTAKYANLLPDYKQYLNLDEMRGLATLLVVTFHAASSEKLLRYSVFDNIIEVLMFVRMPLFIGITGYLYGARREQLPMSMTGWRKRMKRITPPFLLLTLICWIISIPTDHSFDLINGIVFGAWHLWYLQALSIILLVMALIDTHVGLSSQKLWCFTVNMFLVSASGVASGMSWFSIGKAVYLSPYFLLGASIGAAPEFINERENRWAIYTCGAIALIIQQAGMAGIGWYWSKTSLVGSAIGIASFIIISRCMPEDKILRWIGSYSFPIFLWHLPISSVLTATLLNYLDLQFYTIILAKVVFGVSLPIGMSVFCMRNFQNWSIFVGCPSSSKEFCLGNQVRC